MKKIIVFNKKDAKNYIPKDKAIIIRMGDSLPFPKLKGSYIEEKSFYFSDVDAISDYAITNDDAKEIISFVDKYINKVNEIIVHCEYGQGRSPAVAFAISEYLKSKNISIEEQNYLDKYPNINKYIFEKIKLEF